MKSKILLLFSALIVLAGCGASTEKQFAKTALEMECQVANQTLADKYVDAVTICKSCQFDGKNVIYNYELDEELAALESIDKSLLESRILENWKTNPAVRATKQNLLILDGSVVYNYTGSKSKKTLTVTIKPPKDSEE